MSLHLVNLPVVTACTALRVAAAVRNYAAHASRQISANHSVVIAVPAVVGSEVDGRREAGQSQDLHEGSVKDHRAWSRSKKKT